MKTKKASLAGSLTHFFLVMLLFLGIRWAIIEPYVIPSGSMIPTLLVNDHITVSKYDYGIRLPFTKTWITGPKMPERGDIIVFESVEDPKITMIKRVVGLPGDYVIPNDEGRVLQPGEPTDGAVHVPEGQLFMMGDNRGSSRDSRFWGTLPIGNIIGHARWIWLSCSQTVSQIDFICDPRHIDWQRVFTQIK